MALLSDTQPVNIQLQRLPASLCRHQFLGDLSEEDPPVPIPNTVVKLLSPDGTAQATVWESRKSPGLILKSPAPCGAFLFAEHHSYPVFD